ncbi:hypothetical protein [Kitasatospora purpeofusca]|uniref:hypothetical protein n=1 Tax=Kitasatospora purpeofusca TaxID=67352 RepID=UPI003F4AAB0B
MPTIADMCCSTGGSASMIMPPAISIFPMPGMRGSRSALSRSRAYAVGSMLMAGAYRDSCFNRRP